MSGSPGLSSALRGSVPDRDLLEDATGPDENPLPWHRGQQAVRPPGSWASAHQHSPRPFAAVGPNRPESGNRAAAERHRRNPGRAECEGAGRPAAGSRRAGRWPGPRRTAVPRPAPPAILTLSAVQQTALIANTDLPIATSPTTPRPTSTPASLSLSWAGFPGPPPSATPRADTRAVRRPADHEQQRARDESDASGMRDEAIHVQQVGKARCLGPRCLPTPCTAPRLAGRWHQARSGRRGVRPRQHIGDRTRRGLRRTVVRVRRPVRPAPTTRHRGSRVLGRPTCLRSFPRRQALARPPALHAPRSR